MNCSADECGDSGPFPWVWGLDYLSWASRHMDPGPFLPFITCLEDLPDEFVERWGSANSQPVAILRYKPNPIPLWSNPE